MARGGGSYDDIVKAVMAQIAKSRPDVVNAGKSVADDVSGIAAAAKSAVQSALGKPPKVTSRTARTVTPKPSRTMTKAERRAQNQQIDRERLPLLLTHLLLNVLMLRLNVKKKIVKNF